MDYYIDVVDTWGRRITTIKRAPLLEIECGDPSSSTRIAGLLPSDLTDMGHVGRELYEQRHCRGASRRPDDDFLGPFGELLIIRRRRQEGSGNPHVLHVSQDIVSHVAIVPRARLLGAFAR